MKKRKDLILISIFFVFLIIIYLLLKPRPENLKKEKIAPFDPPRRIVSLGPAITKGLYLLGVGDKLIADTVYCNKPPEAQSKQKIGTVTKVDVEKIVRLKPDLVLATSLSDAEQIEKLKNLGIRVIRFPKINSFRELCESFFELGRTVGKKELAKEIICQAEEEISLIKQKVMTMPKPKVLIQLGAKPLWVVTKDSFINDLIEIAGGINIGPSDQKGLYSREEALKQNPDVIIIATMGIVGKEEKKIWQKYQTINAIRNNRIYIFNSDKLCSPTPVSFVGTLKELTKILHPQIKLKEGKDE